MQRRGKAWTVQDRTGDPVYLTWERWEHIVFYHPDMAPFFDEVRQAVQQARRLQDALNQYKYFYRTPYDYLARGYDVIEVVVAVNAKTGDRFVVTAYLDDES